MSLHARRASSAGARVQQHWPTHRPRPAGAAERGRHGRRGPDVEDGWGRGVRGGGGTCNHFSRDHFAADRAVHSRRSLEESCAHGDWLCEDIVLVACFYFFQLPGPADCSDLGAQSVSGGAEHVEQAKEQPCYDSMPTQKMAHHAHRRPAGDCWQRGQASWAEPSS